MIFALAFYMRVFFHRNYVEYEYGQSEYIV